MPLPLPLAVTPLAMLIAASPVAVTPAPPQPDGLIKQLQEAGPDAAAAVEAGGASGQVETFDPIARAQLIAQQMPRQWQGRYQPFDTATSYAVQLVLDQVSANGQMVDLAGRISIDGIETPVQGNLNAKSDQLDLLLIGDQLGGGLQPGGEFQGLQGMALSGWHAPRLTSAGGRLQMGPASAPAPASNPGPGQEIRGLW